MSMFDNSSTQDIDALLAEADSLMDEMSTKLEAGTPDGNAAPETSSDPAAQELAGMVEEMSASIASVDSDAVAEALANPPRESAESDPPEAGDLDESASADASGPLTAPAEWLDEAEVATDLLSGQAVPTIDETADTPVVAAAQVRQTAAVQKTHRLLRVMLHAPIGLLVLMDRPFARLGPNVKNCIGYAAVATVLIAAGTWAVGTVYLQ